MINIGVVGTSWITDEFIKCASLVDDFKLNAVYSRTEEKAKAFAEKYGVTNIFTDLEAMAKSNCIDAVYIASPNSLHAEQAIIFLNNKKHVLCEKPVASNVKELNSMIAAAKNNDMLLMEAMKTMFLPNFKVIEDNLHKLGKIRKYFASYCQYSSRYDIYKEGKHVNTFDPKFSNGSIMDIGTYCIHPLVRLFGMPKHIKASALKLPSGIDGEGSLILSYEDMEGVIIHSKIANSYIPCEIQGEKGTMIIDKINNTEKVQIIYRNGECEELSVPQLKETMYYEAKEFIELIKSNKKESEINSYNQSLNVIEIIEEARKQTGILFPADNLKSEIRS
ncbi:Gfo/Idh/MocA family protein [Clostridium sp. DJ247]|uniref:Gfo/Idh/MocA family protein n=1 Tax=Clostridium sp. DJ247 TaxID=2726188 RepID=UPI0016231EAB|nr:Gfo/Idh/MocA family oxidoreductase [Clostridium sp. DJ247]MBC2579454.1 Gfo/Idh/MocA family oxidoreductase [Clostridium sp. DJ247]